MSAPDPLTLVAMDEAVLKALVRVATTDAAVDDVTPPLTPGATWTAERIAWLQDFHRLCRAGLDGPAGQATWAVLLGTDVIGSVRLQRIDRPGTLITGLWLSRSARGLGLGRRTIAAVLDEAGVIGARTVQADTTSNNAAAMAVLHSTGFAVMPGLEPGLILAVRDLGDP